MKTNESRKNVPTSNRFSPREDIEEIEEIGEKKKDQVFYQDPNKLGITLSAIMDRLAKMEEKQEVQCKQINLAKGRHDYRTATK